MELEGAMDPPYPVCCAAAWETLQTWTLHHINTQTIKTPHTNYHVRPFILPGAAFLHQGRNFHSFLRRVLSSPYDPAGAGIEAPAASQPSSPVGGQGENALTNSYASRQSQESAARLWKMPSPRTRWRLYRHLVQKPPRESVHALSLPRMTRITLPSPSEEHPRERQGA